MAASSLLTLAGSARPVGAARLLEDSSPNSVRARWGAGPGRIVLPRRRHLPERIASPRRWPDIAMRPLSPLSPSPTQPAVGPTWPSISTIASLARLIRLAQTKKARQTASPNWRQILEAEGLAVHSSTAYLEPERIGDLRVASDYRIEGMGHIYRSSGLGVPLVAHRWTDATAQRTCRNSSSLARCELRRRPSYRPAGGYWAANGGETRDLATARPVHHQSMVVGHRDNSLSPQTTTTPLATQVSRSNLATLEWTGLFDSNFERLGVDAGLYMLRPYEPGKIPVVFVHGLVSSPRAWVQVINELQNTPELAARYQFWLFMYPTGRPIPGSAAGLRAGTRAGARDMLDPNGSDAAFDHMVMVGHSMGGVLAKMMAQDSQLQLWDAAITVPRDQFKAPPEFKKTPRRSLDLSPGAVREPVGLHRHPPSRQPGRRQRIWPGRGQHGATKRRDGRAHRRSRGSRTDRM